MGNSFSNAMRLTAVSQLQEKSNDDVAPEVRSHPPDTFSKDVRKFLDSVDRGTGDWGDSTTHKEFRFHAGVNKDESNEKLRAEKARVENILNLMRVDTSRVTRHQTEGLHIPEMIDHRKHIIDAGSNECECIRVTDKDNNFHQLTYCRNAMIRTYAYHSEAFGVMQGVIELYSNNGPKGYGTTLLYGKNIKDLKQ